MPTKPRFLEGTLRGSLRWISVAALLFAVAAQAATSSLKKETIGKHVCYVYVPAKVSSHSTAPLLMMFHGSRRDGMSQINEWRKLAETEGIILAAPDALNPQYWQTPDDGPDLLRDIVAFAGRQYRIDPRRIYAFGHSAGAEHMLKVAPLESTYLAAVAVHAGEFANARMSGLLNFAERKIPIFIVIGTKDQFFPLESVHQTRDAFAAEGFPIEVREMPNHDHNYYRLSRQINDMVWAFLSPIHLDADARYRAYRIVANGDTVSINVADR